MPNPVRSRTYALTAALAVMVAVPGLAQPSGQWRAAGYSPSGAALTTPSNRLPGGRPAAVETFTSPPFCAGPLQVQGVDAFVCEFPVNWVFEEADLAQFATSEFGVTIQAVGGRGGDGGSSIGGTTGGGAGGQPGLAQATLRGDALVGKSLYLYVGNNGSFGVNSKGGSGGAATVVATEALTPKPGSLDDMLVAAGGGGGGQGYAGTTNCVANPADDNEIYTDLGCAGGDGGVAIGIDAQNRFGFARPGATPPVSNFQSQEMLQWTVLNDGAGQAARFDAGAWVAGAGGSGGSAGAAAFSFAGAPGAGSTGAWVRETAALLLGTATVVGGQGSGVGGGGGGGVAGGGGSGAAGGAGGASFAVGSGYGLPEGDALSVPCEAEGFCAQNWLSPAGTDQPTVVVTFWLNQGADPLIPNDGEVIDSDQPSLVFDGDDASAGIHYLLEDPFGQIVNYSGLINGSATGNFLWTVPSGLLSEGLTYDWFVTDQSGNTLQDIQSFSIATGTSPSGLTQGWTLYVRSMDDLDSSLTADLKPLDNQPVPKVSTSCSCLCETSLGPPGPASEPSLVGPAALGETYPNCGGYISKAYCDCNWSATGDEPTAAGYWNWTVDTGSGCTSSSGSCYANAQVQSGTIDLDWASASNPLGLQVPSRLINITSEPSLPQDGDAVPSLAVPAITGFSGGCTDASQVEVTFTSRTNGGVRFQIYAEPTSGEQTSTASTAIDDWNIPNCSWSGNSSQPQGGTGGNQAYSNEYMAALIYQTCQASVAEQTGSQRFCLTPGTAYRVRFDGVQPYLPGPMELGFKLAGMDAGAPIPANWISTCRLDGSTGNCSNSAVSESGTANGFIALIRSVDSSAVGEAAPAGRPARTGPTYAGNREAFGERAQQARARLDPVYQAREDRRTRVAGVRAPLPRQSPPLLSAENGTAGAESCTAAGSSVTCTWTANGTWQLPSLYTQPGGWITMQAVGGAGGVGDPAASNPGGDAGRAQAVLPAESLAGKTLFAYVGQSGADAGGDSGESDTAAGGAASLVTTAEIPASFVSNDCVATAEDIGALIIAGGGGGGGVATKYVGNNPDGYTQTSASGGTGGVAFGGSGIQQTIGSGGPGGQGTYALGGQAPAYGSNPFDGSDAVSGGYSARAPYLDGLSMGSASVALGGGRLSSQTATWLANTSYLRLDPPPPPGLYSLGLVCGGGATNVGGGGGGGHAAGGGASYGELDGFASDDTTTSHYAAGGGGGSSWATGAGAGITLPAALTDWQTLANNDPSQVVITIDCPSCVFLSECAVANGSSSPVVRCEFGQSVQPLAVASLGVAVGELIGLDTEIGDQVPVYVEAWGGSGGNAGDFSGNCESALGGGWGMPGYARSSHTFGGLSQLFESAWLYIGANGPNGPWVDPCASNSGAPGAGGAATLVLSAPLSAETRLEDILVVAGGGGGGGQAFCAELCIDGKTPRRGGQAIGTTSGSVSASGQGESGGGDGTGGQPGGADGIGGLGGGVGSGAATGWVGLSSEWAQGQGGQSPGGTEGAGSGGGGYGGGGVGGKSSRNAYGGGAGGSYAARATLDDSNAPVLGPPDLDYVQTPGKLVITLDVCSTYPTLEICQ